MNLYKNLNKEFYNSLSVLKKIKKYVLEDLSIKIDNMESEYDHKILKRISFLREQSEIAKELGIERNTLEVQRYGVDDNVFSYTTIDLHFLSKRL